MRYILPTTFLNELWITSRWCLLNVTTNKNLVAVVSGMSLINSFMMNSNLIYKSFCRVNGRIVNRRKFLKFQSFCSQTKAHEKKDENDEYEEDDDDQVCYKQICYILYTFIMNNSLCLKMMKRLKWILKH